MMKFQIRRKIILIFSFFLAASAVLTQVFANEFSEEFFVFEYLALVSRADGFATNSQAMALDSDTGVSPPLDYWEVFDPPAVPYQRNAALNHLHLHNDTLLLTERSRERRRIAVSPIQNSMLQRRAKISLQLKANDLHAIPSDSPDMQITAIESWPKTQLHLYKDENDIYYLQAQHTGNYEIQYHTQSPRPRTEPKADAGTLRAKVAIDAKIRKFIEKEVKDTDVASILVQENAIQRLFWYFRSFSSAPLDKIPEDSALLRQILLEGKGLCRHRGFAFVVLAQYLGYEARLITNDAHAFVELRQGSNWYRLELGGEAEALRVQYSDGRAAKNLRAAEFLQPHEELETNVRQSSLGGDARDSAHGALRGESERASAQAPLRGEGETRGLPRGSDAGGDFPPKEKSAESQDLVKEEIEIRLDNADFGAMKRGAALRVSGLALRENGEAAENVGLVLEFWGAEARRVLGRARSDGAGRFEFQADVPLDLPLGRGEIRVQALP